MNSPTPNQLAEDLLRTYGGQDWVELSDEPMIGMVNQLCDQNKLEFDASRGPFGMVRGNPNGKETRYCYEASLSDPELAENGQNYSLRFSFEGIGNLYNAIRVFSAQKDSPWPRDHRHLNLKALPNNSPVDQHYSRWNFELEKPKELHRVFSTTLSDNEVFAINQRNKVAAQDEDFISLLCQITNASDIRLDWNRLTFSLPPSHAVYADLVSLEARRLARAPLDLSEADYLKLHGSKIEFPH